MYRMSNLVLRIALVLAPGSITTPLLRASDSLDGLVERYRAYGLPLPPREAKLVRFDYPGGTVNGVQQHHTHLAFLLKEGSKETPPRLLLGTREFVLDKWYKATVTTVEPKPELAGEITGAYVWYEEFTTNQALATAVQCKARGWDALAGALLEKSLAESVGDDIFAQRANLPAKTALAYLAWAHSANELIEPRSDRARIARRIRNIFTDEPGLDTSENQAFLRSLEGALKPSQAKPRSVEALIDDLVDLPYERMKGGREIVDNRYRRIAELGFEAVPALIAHLDDARLTRTIEQGEMRRSTRHLVVHDLVEKLLRGLSGESAARQWRRRVPDDSHSSWPLHRDDVQAWWLDIQKAKEEAHLASHALSDDPKAQSPNRPILELLSKKYPQHLEKIYRTILDERPQMQSWPVVEAIAKSSLPNEKKVELLLQAAKHKNLEHRRAAFWELKNLDHKQFVTLLIETLDGLPKRPTEPYWICREATFANLVIETDDQRAWQTLAKVAKQSDVGLRMEMIGPMSYGKPHRTQRLRFLASFLDDATVRDATVDPRMFKGPYSGGEFPKLEVRNFAAHSIAWVLELGIEPTKDWTPEQWTQLRNRARKELEREGIDVPQL